MNEKIAAAKLSLIKTEDITLRILEVFNIAGELNIKEVIKYYKRILKGEYEVAEVVTALELDESAKQKIEENLKRRFPDKELIFVFDSDPEIEGGIRIIVGDNKITFSFENKL